MTALLGEAKNLIQDNTQLLKEVRCPLQMGGIESCDAQLALSLAPGAVGLWTVGWAVCACVCAVG